VGGESCDMGRANFRFKLSISKMGFYRSEHPAKTSANRNLQEPPLKLQACTDVAAYSGTSNSKLSWAVSSNSRKGMMGCRRRLDLSWASCGDLKELLPKLCSTSRAVLNMHRTTWTSKWWFNWIVSHQLGVYLLRILHVGNLIC
jgi:hypothetical protein